MVEKTLGQTYYEMIASIYLELTGRGGPAWEELTGEQRSQFEESAKAKAIEFFGVALERLRSAGALGLVELIKRGIEQGAKWNF